MAWLRRLVEAINEWSYFPSDSDLERMLAEGRDLWYVTFPDWYEAR